MFWVVLAVGRELPAAAAVERVTVLTVRPQALLAAAQVEEARVVAGRPRGGVRCATSGSPAPSSNHHPIVGSGTPLL